MRYPPPRPRLHIVAATLVVAAGLLVAALTPLAAQTVPQAVRNAAQSASRAIQIGVVVTEDTRLNMRSAPEASASIVSKLDPGVEVQVLGYSDDGQWIRARTLDGGTSGWVAAEYIGLTQAEDDASPAGELANNPEADEAAATTLLLPTPTPTAARVAAADQDVVTDAANMMLPTPTPRASVTATPAQRARLAAGPTASPAATSLVPPAAIGPELAPVLSPVSVTTPLPLQTAVAVTVRTDAEDEEAVQPEAPSATAEETETAPQATPSVPTAITQPERMNLRAGPGTDYPVAGSAPSGTAYEVLAYAPGRQWLQVRVEGAIDPAWIFGDLVNLVGPVQGLAELSEDQLPPAPTPAPVAAQPAVQAAAAPAAPPPSGAGFFGYGVQAHLIGGGAGAALTAVNDMGFNWVKQQVEWRLFQPQPGAIGFGELGGIVSEAGNRGLNVLFSVVNAPQWAREPGFDGSVGGPPADPQTYAAFVGAMAGQFCGTSLKAIEIWNEQNLHYEWGNKPLDPAEYMNLLKAAYASIKAACPEMLVISGALTPAGSNPPFAVDDFAYLEGMYQNGLAAYSDGIGAHPSGYNVPASVRWEEACSVIQQTGNSFNGACDTPHHSWSFRSTMEGYRNIMVVYGDPNKRIWPTEFGWAAGGAFDPRYAYANDNGFDEQAAWTVEAYTMMRDWGWVGPAFLWNLNFRVVADGTEKAQWGIVGNDYQPLPVYLSLKAMPK